MIITQLIGGLGNQLFQYAAGKALAHQYQVPLKIDVTELIKKASENVTTRQFDLSIFNTEIEIASKEDFDLFYKKDQYKIGREVQRRFPQLFKSIVAVENNTLFNQSFFKYPKNTYLKGFWQSELYFKSIEDIIRNDLTFKSDIKKQAASWEKMVTSVCSISVHVRRGDYVTNQSTHQFHGLCSMAYYTEAVEYMKIRAGKDIQLFIFSDDMEWCKEHFKVELPICFVETNNSYQDLYLMSQCKHHIIANSSFSWWGAWLNPNKNKIVVAPKKWFNNPSINSYDVIPSSWIKI